MNRKPLGWLFVAAVVILVGQVIWSWATARKVEALAIVLLPLPLAGAGRIFSKNPAKPETPP
jgi:hypothetical protein